MNRQKREVGGQFLKPDDIGNEVGDMATLIIAGPGESTEAEFDGVSKERLELPITIEGEEKLFSLSPTNENVLIDKFGEETEKWNGKEIKVVLNRSNVGKSGFCIAIRKKD